MPLKSATPCGATFLAAALLLGLGQPEGQLLATDAPPPATLLAFTPPPSGLQPQNRPAPRSDGPFEATPRPPLDAGRVTGQLLLGPMVGSVVGLTAASIAATRCHDDDELLGNLGCQIENFLYFGAPAYAFGNTATIYAIGNLGNETGSFFLPLLGSLAGTYAGLLAGGAAGSFVPFFAISSLSGTISFNLTRRYREPPPGEDRRTRSTSGLQLAVHHIPPRPGNPSLFEVAF